MIFQKPKTIRNVVFVIIGVSIALIVTTLVAESCPVKHQSILYDLERYSQTLDPELCQTIVFKIDAFNEQCEPEIEIIDCG